MVQLQWGTRNFGDKNPEKNLKIARTVINYPYPPYFYNTRKKFKNYHDQGNFGLNFVTFCHILKDRQAQNLLNYAHSHSACRNKSNDIKSFSKMSGSKLPVPTKL